MHLARSTALEATRAYVTVPMQASVLNRGSSGQVGWVGAKARHSLIRAHARKVLAEATPSPTTSNIAHHLFPPATLRQYRHHGFLRCHPSQEVPGARPYVLPPSPPLLALRPSGPVRSPHPPAQLSEGTHDGGWTGRPCPRLRAPPGQLMLIRSPRLCSQAAGPLLRCRYDDPPRLRAADACSSSPRLCPRVMDGDGKSEGIAPEREQRARQAPTDTRPRQVSSSSTESTRHRTP